MNQDWFKAWFDTGYYHSLYDNRDEKEAQSFLDQLMAKLQLPKTSKILDAPCGRGRHARYLNEMGYTVDGIDISPSSIQYANETSGDTLHFYEASMEDVFRPGAYDLLINLFTSFGYWDDPKKNQEVFKSLVGNLNDTGCMVMDFLNADYVKQNLNTEKEFVKKDSVEYEIQRSIDGDMVLKHIKFYDHDNAEQGDFTERVKLLTKDDFDSMAKDAGMQMKEVYGDYNLGSFDPQNSQRLIMIFAR